MNEEFDITRFPGYLGFTSRGVLAIHADWPIYPAEHGWEIALLAFGNFPKGTTFKQIDDIDRCLLFFANSPHYTNITDFTNKKYFHIAVWHEDLIELSEKGYVTGVKRLTEYEWECRKYEQLPKGAFYECKGEKHYIERPPIPMDYDEEYEDYPKDFVYIDGKNLNVTKNGYKALENLIMTLSKNLDKELASIVQPLIDLGRYDTAIRESCLMIETLLRRLTGLGNDFYGTKLIEGFYDAALASDRYVSAYLKVLRGELRTAFKFVRNDYMHNFVSIDIEQCFSILYRISAILQTLRLIDRL